MSMAEAARAWGRRVTAVISQPGDRDPSVHELAARAIARGFERMIVKEDCDRRGRAPGEVASIIERTVKAERPSADCIVIPDEAEAIRHALATMQEEEVERNEALMREAVGLTRLGVTVDVDVVERDLARWVRSTSMRAAT